jgi:hypothetical protein
LSSASPSHPSNRLSFAEEFDAPVVRSRLHAFLLLANSTQPYLSLLLQEMEREFFYGVEWHAVVAILAKGFADQIPSLVATEEVRFIWARFLNDNVVARLGARTQHVLGKIQESLHASLAKPELSQEYLLAANERGAEWVRSILRRHRLLSPPETVVLAPMFVYFDPEARLFCASANRLSGQICWGLQFKRHAFFGALIADLIFAHEYLSHLLPRNRHLSRMVREIWLVSVLHEILKNAADPHSRVYLFLWEKFRWELAKHFRASEIQLFGPLRLDLFAAKMCFHAPELFWSLTSGILNLEDLPERAKLVDDLLIRLASLSDKGLNRILSAEWRGLDEMFERANATY